MRAKASEATSKQLSNSLAPHSLCIMGIDGPRVLVGPKQDWWPIFQDSPEAQDGGADPIDRWSKRVIGGIAQDMGAHAAFPSDGPPYAPFIAWALDTGRFWQSPTGMMVHDTAGLMISIRGALIFDHHIAAPASRPSPCDDCETQPCLTACPVGALSAQADYDVPACKGYLDTPPGADCMANGCKARRACPISAAFDRPAAQSAMHMASFHP